MPRAPDLPDFEHPPIDEVSIGYLFPRVLNFSDGLIGAFWETIRSEYPRTELQPRADGPLENLEPGPIPMQQVVVPIFGPDQGRTWLITADDQFVAQIQDNRFLLNWRKRDASYPHFDGIRTRFNTMFESYGSFLHNHGASQPAIQQLEVTYVNWIPEADMATFLKPAKVATLTFTNISGQPTDAALAFRYFVTGTDGRPTAGLYVQCLPAIRVHPPGRGSQLQLTFRAPLSQPPTVDLLDALAEAARDAIVRTFTELTTEEAHQAWGRII